MMTMLMAGVATLTAEGVLVSVDVDLPDGWLDDVCQTDADRVIGDTEWLAAALRCGLAQALPYDVLGQVSLLLTDDVAVRELNRRYRGLDETTDVLSFSAEHAGEWQGDDGWVEDEPAVEFPIPDGELPPLGDVVIAVPQAARQAVEQGAPLHREMALLLVHGALHLLGYDHLDEASRAGMQELERAALGELFGLPGR